MHPMHCLLRPLLRSFWVQAQLLNLKGWRGFNNPWHAEGEDQEEYLYINLLANPERYTGKVKAASVQLL
jgi:hypothetical protein